MKRLLILIVVSLVLCSVVQATVIGSHSYNEYCTSISAHHDTPASCLDLRCGGSTASGVYTIYPTEDHKYSVEVFCDQTTDGGGWTVFQRRMDGSVNFYRNWQNYKLGFGDVNAEHWLGNDKIHALTSLHTTNELRVDLEAFDNVKAYAKYSTFKIGDESQKYVLTATGYSGDAGDPMTQPTQPANGQPFSTYDRDSDSYEANCAEKFHGAWWYKACHGANLNGKYLGRQHDSYANGVNWFFFRGHHESMKTTEMKFRGQV